LPSADFDRSARPRSGAVREFYSGISVAASRGLSTLVRTPTLAPQSYEAFGIMLSGLGYQCDNRSHEFAPDHIQRLWRRAPIRTSHSCDVHRCPGWIGVLKFLPILSNTCREPIA
jgi:hypothetical protein